MYDGLNLRLKFDVVLAIFERSSLDVSLIEFMHSLMHRNHIADTLFAGSSDGVIEPTHANCQF